MGMLGVHDEPVWFLVAARLIYCVASPGNVSGLRCFSSGRVSDGDLALPHPDFVFSITDPLAHSPASCGPLWECTRADCEWPPHHRRRELRRILRRRRCRPSSETFRSHATAVPYLRICPRSGCRSRLQRVPAGWYLTAPPRPDSRRHIWIVTAATCMLGRLVDWRIKKSAIFLKPFDIILVQDASAMEDHISNSAMC
ncbi:uncharacterized protein [Triticum aestivum]|uniref:uncharacterized protein n=1 Tax=Triticum aestivum TaxID=4565 RepID=UPI001D033E82|nr:uncharacterized protein LOC123067288 [Triticum aestivum]